MGEQIQAIDWAVLHWIRDVLHCGVQLHDFNTDEATKATKES